MAACPSGLRLIEYRSGGSTRRIPAICLGEENVSSRDAVLDGLARHIRGPLQLEVPPSELGDLQEFDVRVLLRSSSGVEHGAKACAALRALKVEGK